MAMNKGALVAALESAFATAATKTSDPAAARLALANEIANAVEAYVTAAVVTVLPGDAGLQQYTAPPNPPAPTTGPVGPMQITGGLS
jgi:hypothetical protein